MATNQNGHKLERPQFQKATDWSCHKLKQPQIEMATNQNGHRPNVYKLKQPPKPGMATPHNILTFCKVHWWFPYNRMCIIKTFCFWKSFGNTLSMRNCYYNYIETKHKLCSYSWGRLDMPHAVFSAELSSVKVELKIQPRCLLWKCGRKF